MDIIAEKQIDIANVKLIATDMDGTLLNGEKELPPDFYQVFQQIHAQGILFAAASGRQFFNLQQEFEPIKDDILFIAENGSYVRYKNEDLWVQDLPENSVAELIQIARTIPNAHIILCGKKRAYLEDHTPAFLEQVNMYYREKAFVKDLTQVTGDQFLKIAICDLNGAEHNSYSYFKSLQHQFQVKVSGKIWLDLSHKDAHKGRAIQIIQERFQIGFNETMVFGDYLNDLEMMREAYFSYAVENAHPDIKQASNFVTASNDEGGVTKVLDRLLAARQRNP